MAGWHQVTRRTVVNELELLDIAVQVAADAADTARHLREQT